jgi:SAM-dependent methyltransferase
MDPIAQFKANQRQGWALFTPFEVITGTVSPRLVKFAQIREGAEVLDVGCGTGVLALTAARAGARVTGLDLTPELLVRAKENAALVRAEVKWHEGDAEALPFSDSTFDFVVSQFGHMFAPRPEVAVREMLRVLKPGGTIAFATWPPELYTGRIFALIGRHSPAPPAGVAPPPAWGDPNVVRERLGSAVKDIAFDRDVMRLPALSPGHVREMSERSIGPMIHLTKNLSGDANALATFRREFEDLVSLYFEDNVVRQDYLLTRATKI